MDSSALPPPRCGSSTREGHEHHRHCKRHCCPFAWLDDDSRCFHASSLNTLPNAYPLDFFNDFSFTGIFLRVSTAAGVLSLEQLNSAVASARKDKI
jgi:hypothetical protein